MKYLVIPLFAYFLFTAGALAQISNLQVNGSSTSFMMISGDSITWSYDVSPAGATTTVEIWYDVNGNGAIDQGTDVLFQEFAQTDGDASGNNGPPDMDGSTNGATFISMPVGVAPGKYVLEFTQGGTSLNVTGTVNPLASPAHTVSGTVTVPSGKSSQNIFVEAKRNGNYQPDTWYGITDANGNYKIQMNADTAGNPWTIDIVQNPYAPDIITPPERHIAIVESPSGVNFSIVAAAAKVSGFVKDESGNPVASTEVRAIVTNDSSDIHYAATADSNGKFQIGIPASDLISGRDWIVTIYNENNGVTTGLLDAIAQVGSINVGDSVLKNLTIYETNSSIKGKIEILGSAPGYPIQIVAQSHDTAQAVTWSEPSTGNFTLPVTDKIFSYQIFPINLKSKYNIPYVTAHPGSTGIVVNLTSTGVSKHVQLPGSYYLSQNYPNPFNPTTEILFSLPCSQLVTLKVYDVVGREVATLVNGRQIAGSHRVKFDGSRLTSGVYSYRLIAGNYISTRKLLLIK